MSDRKNAGIEFRLRRGMSIGEADAESDQNFLEECFTDTGDYQTLADPRASQRIIVGRTGAGKSALICHLKDSEENVIEIPPENLSLNYISNSDIINTLEKSGVKLDLFYKLLWQHVFAVELLRAKFDLTTEEKTNSWLTSLLRRFRQTNQTKERALAYLRDWGDKFWCETEYRIKEVTEKLENDVTTQLGSSFDLLKANVSAGAKNTSETKAEIVHKAQQVINSIQVKALSDVLSLLAEDVFDDQQQVYYIVIDKLDENWVDSSLRYRLIRALIETVKRFRSIAAVKIVIGLRYDLIRTVFDKTHDAGFQEEKYEALMLHLKWTQASLESLLDKRISLLLREQYTTHSIGLRSLFPKSVGRTDFVDYFFSRTFFRPRDAIAFVNESLKKSEDKGFITVQAIREAEIEYSRQRVEALCFEWFDHYPSLKSYLPILEQRSAKFKLSTISKDVIDNFCIAHCCDSNAETDDDPVIRSGNAYLMNGSTHHAFVIAWVRALFTIGIVGVKPDGFTSVIWQDTGTRLLTDGQIKPTSHLHVHPMVWARLGTRIDD